MIWLQRFTADGTLSEQWDDGTRTYTDYRTDPDTTRPYTADENTDADARTTQATRDYNLGRMFQAMSNARQTNTTFLGLTSPTNAQTVAQVKALTRQNNAIMRVLYGVLSGDATSLDGTD